MKITDFILNDFNWGPLYYRHIGLKVPVLSLSIFSCGTGLPNSHVKLVLKKKNLFLHESHDKFEKAVFYAIFRFKNNTLPVLYPVKMFITRHFYESWFKWKLMLV